MKTEGKKKQEEEIIVSRSEGRISLKYFKGKNLRKSTYGEIFQVKAGLKNRKCSSDELMKAKTAIEEVYSEVAGKSAMFSQSDLYPPYFDYKDDSLLCESGYIKFAELELCLELYEDKVKDLEKIKKILNIFPNNIAIFCKRKLKCCYT